MTWLDITLIIVMVVFVALGARMGSLWTAACLIGGFFGAFLVEYYALPASAMMGGFPGARLVAGTLLFIGGVVVAIVPGWALSRLTAAFLLGIVDGVFGLLAGLLAGIVAVTLAMLFVLPHAPSIEKSKAWKKSAIVKPFHHFIEDVFNDSHFRRESTTAQLKEDFVKDFSPALESTQKSIKETTDSLVEKIKKRK